MDLVPTIEDDDDITIMEEESDTEDDKKVKIFIRFIGIYFLAEATKFTW